MFVFNNEIKIIIRNISLPWIPKIELYYPDLPQFPIIYINTNLNDTHIIACPVAVSFTINDSNCDAEFTVLTNVASNNEVLSKITAELKERIGYSEKITQKDIISCCKNNHQYISLLEDLWQYVQSSYGEAIPYGKYYEEVFSIVRFVAAWQPKTGRQSEMRMLYNFMSAFGENVKMPSKWSHLEFYAIPNLFQLFNCDLQLYPNFTVLDSAMRKLYQDYFSKEINVSGVSFGVMEKAWKQNKDDFINLVSNPMYISNRFSENEKLAADTLVDAFNRHAWRAAYFISAYINISKNYASWSKDFFIEFYENGTKLKGYSEKVIACFLQQGFLNKDVIPIDTWIKTFYQFPLGISTNIEFFSSFSDLGKLERVIWLASQSNKTNMKSFFDILWCQRYGTIGNGELRGVNPIACYKCKLNKTCVGVKNHNTTLIKLINSSEILNLEKLTNDNPNITFFCLLEDDIPKKCYLVKNNHAILVDEFTGYLLTSSDALSKNLVVKNIISFKDFIS
ncbi:MAG: hypothetical protein R3Y09_10615 [Clostridia bacterium]